MTQLDFAADVGLQRDQVVAALGLDAVPGVVKQADATGAQPVAKIEDGLLHLGSVGVEQALHLKAQALERCRHIAGIVERVAQRAALIVSIADYQSMALDGGGEVER